MLLRHVGLQSVLVLESLVALCAVHLMRNGINGVKKFKCEKCSCSSVTKRSLGHHMASVHNVGELFKCEKCPISSAWRSNLKKHMGYVHNIGDKLQCEKCFA